MSRLTVDIFISVDGWAKGEISPGYFGYFGPDLEQWIAGEMATPQRVLLGRRTYQALAGHSEQSDGSAGPMDELDKVVFSRTLERVTSPNTRICREDLVAEVRRMKADGGPPLRTMGSLSLARQLFDVGQVDRLRLMTFPLIVGDSGREPFFADLAAADLELADHRVLDGRVVLTEYRPTGKDIPRA